ncbi:hypothetical protein QBC46DRAFT_396770 [Diplogelasinospora grovesii]|uniref:Glycosyl transferase CAP10 domain-containing protein n=1 Tax=Diplogelasinospora grovesii TaxID=303347 RepID=A0AAN6MZ14_9PEZI|nr:hypothetical protein QBC46DRAFT_396770 [Diplogelasinospora grovesii]
MVATRDPSMQASQLQGYALVLASCLALGQVIQMLGPSKKMRARPILWVFILVSLVPYMVSIYTANQAQSLVPRVHPLEAVIVNAKMEFEGMLARQSKNYPTAEREYRRRHGIDPPPGFQEWYIFAREYQSPVIDEFDMILESIRPFLRLSGKEINTIIKKAANTPNVELWDCNFSLDRIGTGSNTTECTHPWRTNDRHFGLMFDRLLKDIPKRPLDVRFLVNHLDEPRVLIPPSSGSDKGQFQLTDLTQKSTWDAITKHCPSNADKGGRVEGAFTFITNNSQAMDLCAHPEYKNMHGLFIGPTSFGLIEGTVPILSTGAPSTMGDILFPSPAYNVESDFHYNPGHDVGWDKKKNKLYWAGSTTGGFVSDRSWTSFHRQRFVSLAQNLEPKQHTYLQESNKGVVEQKKTSFWNGRLFDVAFTRIFQCARKNCHDQRQHFRTRNWADKDEAMKYKLAFDLDGNGISGRYYKLLASKSVPLKQTVLKEWHDERLMPWVHYVPVSLGMEELPELIFWLTSTKAGQERAKAIAEQGREWYNKAFREVDMGIYVYRLMLELARVQDPGREAFAV